MKLLAFDTSSSACSVAIQNGARTEVLHHIAPMQQAKLILPMIHQILDSASLTLGALDAIIYGCGPGSFTGVRIATSVAQGLSFAADKPVIPVSSMAAIAQSAFQEHQCTKQMVAIDARMGQVYWALYKTSQNDNVELIGQEIVCHPNELSMPEDHGWSAIGDGWDTYKQSLEIRLGHKPKIIYQSQLPSALALLHLGRAKFQRGEWVTASKAVPVYLR
jgi:tRNA threonylcarbamoyladenosine biosynthesis protein TsaB